MAYYVFYVFFCTIIKKSMDLVIASMNKKKLRHSHKSPVDSRVSPPPLPPLFPSTTTIHPSNHPSVGSEVQPACRAVWGGSYLSGPLYEGEFLPTPPSSLLPSIQHLSLRAAGSTPHLSPHQGKGGRGKGNLGGWHTEPNRTGRRLLLPLLSTVAHLSRKKREPPPFSSSPPLSLGSGFFPQSPIDSRRVHISRLLSFPSSLG